MSVCWLSVFISATYGVLCGRPDRWMMVATKRTRSLRKISRATRITFVLVCVKVKMNAAIGSGPMVRALAQIGEALSPGLSVPVDAA